MVIWKGWFWGSTRPQYFSEAPGAADAGFVDVIQCCRSEEWAKAHPDFISYYREYHGHLSHADRQLLDLFFPEAMFFTVNSVFSHKPTELISYCSLFWESWRIFCHSCASVLLSVEWCDCITSHSSVSPSLEQYDCFACHDSVSPYVEQCDCFTCHASVYPYVEQCDCIPAMT